jgi:glutathione S-transferase
LAGNQAGTYFGNSVVRQVRQYLVGERFTVADAYFGWALLLFGRAGVDVAQWPALVAYLARFQARPQVKAAISIEMQLCKTRAV